MTVSLSLTAPRRFDNSNRSSFSTSAFSTRSSFSISAFSTRSSFSTSSFSFSTSSTACEMAIPSSKRPNVLRPRASTSGSITVCGSRACACG